MLARHDFAYYEVFAEERTFPVIGSDGARCYRADTRRTRGLALDSHPFLDEVRMRRFLAIAVAVALSACGGDSTGPDNRYPAVEGVYAVSFTFDDFPSSLAHGNGTISFSQPNRDVGDLIGSAAMTITLGSTVVFVTTVSDAYVNRDGTIRFQFGNSSGWGFDGAITGRRISGRHILIGDSDSWAGTWTADRR
jgi:hypothetical protein